MLEVEKGKFRIGVMLEIKLESLDCQAIVHASWPRFNNNRRTKGSIIACIEIRSKSCPSSPRC